MKTHNVWIMAAFVAAAIIAGPNLAQADPAVCPLPDDPEVLLGLVFPLVDVNGDGGISLSEIQVLYPVPAQYFDIVDANNDGLVSMAELLTFVPLLEAYLPGGLLGAVDSNGDGVIQYSEISEYASQDQFNQLDANGNGIIDCYDIGETPPVEGEEPPVEGEIEPPVEGEEPPVEGESYCPLPSDPMPILALLLPVVDANGDGGVDPSEIRAIVPDVDQYLDGTGFTLESLFAILDRNDDGIVVLSELAPYVSLLPDDFISYVDTNGDGVVQYGEISEYATEDQFAQLDHNGNGVIDCGDLPEPPVEGEDPVEGGFEPPVEGEAPGEGEGYCPLPSDPMPILALLLPVVDTNGDGGVDPSEIRAIVPDIDLYLEGTGLTLESLFNILDSNDDGIVVLAELAPYTSMLPDDFVSYVDTNGDGVIQYGEIAAYATEDQFAQLDRNGNGVIDCGDLFEGPVEGELPGEGESEAPCPLPRDIEGLFNFLLPLVDTNGDGGINKNEILAVVPDADIYLQQMGYSLDLIFSILDNNHDGKITVNELNDMMPLLCKCGPIDVLSYVDTNGDGVIQPGEVAPYIPADVFANLDTNGNGVLDCEDVPGTPPEGEVFRCDGVAMGLFPFSGIFGYGITGTFPYSFEGTLTKSDLSDPAWLLTGQFTFPTSGYTVLDPVVTIAESYPEQVCVVFNVIEYEGPALQVITTVSVSIEIAVSNEAQFSVNANSIFDPGPGEGEGEGGYEEYCPLMTSPELLLAALWPLVDMDGDGAISLAEADAVYPGFSGYGVWGMLDTDDNGVLTQDELLPYIGFGVQYLDGNGDGVLSFEEVNGFVTNAQFIALDTNANGVLDCEDVGDVPPPPQPCPLPDDPMMLLELLWPIIDENGDGGISLEEIQRVVPMVDQNVFNLADQNKDGLITIDEVYVILPMVLPYTFAPIDSNGNNVLEYEEVSGFIPLEIFQQLDLNGNGVLDCGDLPPREEEGEGGSTGNDEPVLVMSRDAGGNGYYTPGGVLTVTITLNMVNPGTVNALGLWEELPAGWTVAEVVDSSGAESIPEAGASGRIEFAWLVIPAFPATIVYRVNVPAEASGVVTISGQTLYRSVTSTEYSTEIVETLLSTDLGEGWQHTADSDHNWIISLSEILRVIQLYNMHGYHCEPGTEDGYGPGSGDTSCAMHGCDYMTQDWVIDLSELLRMIQLYNAPGHAYHVLAGSEDGFAPGAFGLD